jgi:hypothetical protein
MASSYDNDLRLNEMATGDQSGAWGTVTNLNLEMIAEAFSYGTEVITTNADTHATIIADGAADAGRAMVLKYTGTLDSACTITISGGDASTFTVSKLWYIHNATSGSQNIIITSGSGANITIANGQTKCVYTDGAGSGGAVIDTFAALSVVDLFVDDDLTVTGDIDVDGTTNLDAVDIDGAVQLDATLTVGANDQGYDVTLHGDTAARNVVWDSSADSLIFSDNAKAVFGAGDDLEIVHNGSYSLIKDSGTGNLVIAAADLQITNPAVDENFLRAYENGAVELYHDNAVKIATTATGVEVTGAATVGGAAVKVAGKETMFVPAVAMYPSTTNPCSDVEQVETTALRPDLKVLDFAADADDFAQFAIAMPASWNEGTVTFQPFWTVTGTNTGTVAWQLAGIAVSNDDTINTAFGTQVATTALAFSGTSNDLMVSAESGAVTIAGSPAANDMCFFQINRDTSADDQTGAARLLGVKMFFTTDAANDA